MILDRFVFSYGMYLGIKMIKECGNQSESCIDLSKTYNYAKYLTWYYGYE